MPVIFSDELVAVVYLGHFAPSGKSKLARQLPVISDDLIEELKKYGRFIAEYICLSLQVWINEGGLTGKKKPEEYYIKSCRRFIDGHYSEDISLSDLAGILKVDPNYLGSLIKNIAGKSFRVMLTEKRIAQAERLLQNREYGITQIAYMCGFNDSNYFSTVFRKHKKLSPRQFRDKASL